METIPLRFSKDLHDSIIMELGKTKFKVTANFRNCTILTPCCGTNLSRKNKGDPYTCRLCDMETGFPPALPLTAHILDVDARLNLPRTYRDDATEILVKWLTHSLDPLVAIVAAPDLYDYFLSLGLELEDLGEDATSEMAVKTLNSKERVFQPLG